jgi:hypothetical protein
MNAGAVRTRTVGIYVFDEVEVLDLAGRFEVFSTAARVSRRLRPQQPVPFTVVLIADAARAVQARGQSTLMGGRIAREKPRRG